jgi:putative redox protein
LVDIHIDYLGELHCQAEHGPSRKQLETDAPVDNHGRGETFSPTDLLATALGTCMATLMGIRARARGFDINGVHLHVKKLMTTSPPRRVARLEVSVRLPAEIGERCGEDGRAELEHAANTCPVRLSLLDAIEVPVEFDWQLR